MNNQDTNNFNSVSFILFLIKWRKHLFVILAVATILSVVFSMPFFITPKYKANVILFPTSTNSVSKALLAEDFGSKKDILEFGDEEQAEQMLQILNSNAIRSRIIDKYNLALHYGISDDAKYRLTRLHKEYDNNITFRRTEYMAVEINVMDKDPQLAADIANDIAEQFDTLKNQMQRERAAKGLEIVENEYNRLRNEIKDLEDSIQSLRQIGILDYESQAEVLNEQYALALSRNNAHYAALMKEKLDILANHGTSYVSIRDALELLNKQLISVKSKYEEAKVDAEQILPQKFIVSKAFKPEKKSYPVRWLIVVVSVFASLLISIIIIILYENIIKKKDLYFPNKKNIPVTNQLKIED